MSWERLELAVEIADMWQPTDGMMVCEFQEVFMSRQATQWYLRAEIEMWSLDSGFLRERSAVLDEAQAFDGWD